MRYTEIWRFETARFAIVYSVTDDHYLDLSWDDDGLIRDGLERGSLVAFEARVQCLLDGREVGADHLGGCIYESARAFVGDGYFRDMVSMAIAEARKTLSDMPTLRKVAQL
jgi:hypothetical protein